MLEILAEFVAELAIEASLDLELAFLSPYFQRCKKQIQKAKRALRTRSDTSWQWVEPGEFQDLRTLAPSAEAAAMLVGVAQVAKNLSRAIASLPPEQEPASVAHLTEAAVAAMHAGNATMNVLYSPWRVDAALGEAF